MWWADGKNAIEKPSDHSVNSQHPLIVIARRWDHTPWRGVDYSESGIIWEIISIPHTELQKSQYIPMVLFLFFCPIPPALTLKHTAIILCVRMGKTNPDNKCLIWRKNVFEKNSCWKQTSRKTSFSRYKRVTLESL